MTDESRNTPILPGQSTSRWVPGLTRAGTLLVVVVLLVDGLVALVRGANGYYAFSPGTAPLITSSANCRQGGGGNFALPDGHPCVRLVVPAKLAHGINGALFMVDVYVGKATPLDYLLDKVGLLDTVNPGTELLPKVQVLGNTPPSQLGCQDTEQMQGSTSSAAVAALRRLGYSVKEDNLGAQLFQIQPGTPAARAGLRCADVVTAVGTAAVHTAQELVSALRAHRPGDELKITVSRRDAKGTHSVTVTATPTGTPALDGHPAQPQLAFLGVVAQDDATYGFPFGVNIQVGEIGGPSAGLALTLGLIDVLASGNLTGGHRVAATGTIAPDGTVGDVGGVAQKAIAVRRAGAQVFLVPPDELAAARREAGNMKVYAVSSLEQALAVLRQLGGHVPPAPGG